MRFVCLLLPLVLVGCVGDVPKVDAGADAGCPLPAPQPGIACGQTRCSTTSLNAGACCVFSSGVMCSNDKGCTVDAGAVFLWGCDSPQDCTGRTCCVQSPLIASSGCPTKLTPQLPRTACQDICVGNDVRLCASNADCVSPKTCKPATIAGGGDQKVVGACL